MRRVLLGALALAVVLVGFGAANSSAAPSNPWCGKWVGTSSLPPGTKPYPAAADVGYGKYTSTANPYNVVAGGCYAYATPLGSFDYGVVAGVDAATNSPAGTVAGASVGYASPADEHLFIVGFAFQGICKGHLALVGGVYTNLTDPPTYACV